MPPQFTQNILPIERIEQTLQLEPLLFVLFTALSSFLVYIIGLRNLSSERHKNLRGLFKNLLGHILIGLTLLVLFWLIRGETLLIPRLIPYLGFGALLWGVIILVKSFRIFSFEYLFFMNMHTGVPLLLVNMLSLLVTLALASWIATSVFGFRLAPVLATSALFSIVLGLALQETLGNLFSGIALQIDKPYVIGDWIEVQLNNQKLIGKIYEITWRATTLISTGEEWITIPNRIIAQCQILNFSKTKNPIVRSQLFRVPYEVSLKEVKALLIDCTKDIKGTVKSSPPCVLIAEAAESWVLLKLVYSIKDYGEQHVIADQVIENCLKTLQEAGIHLAGPRLNVIQAQRV